MGEKRVSLEGTRDKTMGNVRGFQSCQAMVPGRVAERKTLHKRLKYAKKTVGNYEVSTYCNKDGQQV